MARPAATVSAVRRAMLAKVHMGAKDLGLDEDARRDLMQRLTGHRSGADCSAGQLGLVLNEYRRLGWGQKSRKPKTQPGLVASNPSAAPRSTRAADHPAAKKARALWISLAQLGVVRNGSEQALEAFATRQLKVERLQWADQAQCFRLIEALKKMAERAGWNQDVAGIAPAKAVEILKRRLLAQMHLKLQTPAPACAATALDTAIGIAAAELRERQA